MDDYQKFKEHYIEKLTLQEIRIRMQSRFGRYSLRSLSVQQVAEHIAAEAVYEISCKILGQPNIQQYTVSVDVPKNWWQHLRLTILPGWWLDRRPVKMETINKTVEFNHTALLPKWDMFPRGQEVVMHTQRINKPVK